MPPKRLGPVVGKYASKHHRPPDTDRERIKASRVFVTILLVIFTSVTAPLITYGIYELARTVLE